MRSRVSMKVQQFVYPSVHPSVARLVTRVEISKKKTPFLSKTMLSEGMKRKREAIGTTFISYKYTSKSMNAIKSTN